MLFHTGEGIPLVSVAVFLGYRAQHRRVPVGLLRAHDQGGGYRPLRIRPEYVAY